MRLGTALLLVLLVVVMMLTRSIAFKNDEIAKLESAKCPRVERPRMVCTPYSETVRADTVIEEACIVTRWRM